MDKVDERAQALVNVPGTLSPRRELLSTYEIKAALERNLQGGNYGVYCIAGEQIQRVYGARMRAGARQVRTQSGWVKPSCVYVEG